MNRNPYLTRRSRLIVTSMGVTDFSVVASFDANLRTLGYALDDTLARRLLEADQSEVVALARETISWVMESVGVRVYEPMYPNFPYQVMEATEAELYVNAILHYFGDSVGLRIMPQYTAESRPELDFDESRVKIIRLGSARDEMKMLNALVNQTSAFSEKDISDIKSYSRWNVMTSIDSLPNSENKAVILTYLSEEGLEPPTELFRTATDILRFAVVISGHSPSLVQDNFKFRIPRRIRRYIERALGDLIVRAGKDQVIEDMLRHEWTWKSLAKYLHLGQTTRSSISEVISAIRANGGVTFNSRVEKAISARDFEETVRLLRSRPGDFARRMDQVLRAFPGRENEVLSSDISKILSEASPTVLFQARHHFEKMRSDNSGLRVFLPKGNMSKMKAMADSRTTTIPGGAVDRAVEALDSALLTCLSRKPSMGRVWIDQSTAGLAVPFGMRSSSSSLRTIARGSRLPIPDDVNIIRAFLWWKDGKYRTDIDLSALLLGDDYQFRSQCSYTNLRTTGMVHSGDITSAPNGASEFVDIDIPALREQGRYVIMNLISYSGQNFDELPECFAGFMSRRDMNSGHIYDARTVDNKIDLTAKSRTASPLIIDLERREIIWIDFNRDISINSLRAVNVHTTLGPLVSTVAGMISYSPPQLIDLVTINARARGEIVSDPNDADLIFGKDGDFSPYDVERIMSDLL